jgi:serine/threonine-protein kinase RsbW
MAATQTITGESALRPAFVGGHASRSLIDIEAWMPSEIQAISPLVEQLMRLIEGSQCVAGQEPDVELALRAALNNAVVHGNRLDPSKRVQILCRCELRKGISITVSDQGQGFDPNAVSEPSAIGRIEAQHGRRIRLMKMAMDEVSFEHGGTEVHLRKGPARKSRTTLSNSKGRVFPTRRTTLSVMLPLSGRESYGNNHRE